MEKLRVVVKEPNEPAKVKQIEHDLDSYQNIVDGYIEVIDIPGPGDESISIILNEEGKLYNLQNNIKCPEYLDVLVGNLIFVGNDGEGDFKDLTNDEIDYVLEYTRKNDIKF